MSTQKKILMVVTNHNQIDAEHPTGLWLEEFSIPYQVFCEQGYAVTVASPKGGQAPIDPASLPQKEQAQASAQALHALQFTAPLASLNNRDEFDALFLPGGHGTMYDLPTVEVGQLVSEFLEAGKIVTAVCHGPAALVAAQTAAGQPVVAGRQVTGFTNEEEQAVKLAALMPFLLESRLKELGADFVGTPAWSDHVIVDGNLITGQNPQSSASAAQAVVKALGSPVTA